MKKIILILMTLNGFLHSAQDHSGHNHESMVKPKTTDTSDGLEITIDPVVEQNMGVRTHAVTVGSLSNRIRTVGVIDIPEDNVSHVNMKFSGWIEKQYANETGQKIKKGDRLFDIYSPELVTAQEEYLLALSDKELAESAEDRLKYFGLNQADITQLKNTKKAKKLVTIRSPQSGYILMRNVDDGSHAKKGQNLYKIGDLNKIWVNAEVYDFDAPWVKPNAPAYLELPFMRGKKFKGQVDFIHPVISPKTRTLRVRLEFKNIGLDLKPGMFATVFISGLKKQNIMKIPEEAVIQTGKRQIVFISKTGGKFESREITTGLTGSDGMIEVISGLTPEETIVTSGQFLLDSESQLKEAVQKMLSSNLKAPSKSSGAGKVENKRAEYYYTCGMHPQIVQDKPGTCPICGMNLTRKRK